jgi:hypothetical protein
MGHALRRNVRTSRLLRLLGALVLASIGAGIVACSSSADPDPCEGVPQDSEGCLSARYLTASTTSAGSCSEGRRQVDRRHELAFFQGASTVDATLVSYGAAVQGFYQPYGLTFFMTEPPRRTELKFAINGTDDELAKVEKEVGLEPGMEPTPKQEAELERRVQDILFGPLREFVLAHSEPPHDRVNVVVLGQIASPAVARVLDLVIGGVGLSPRLLRDVAAADPSKNLFDVLALPPEFTPTLFLGHADIAKYKASREAIAAHEMGHALGLQHNNATNNVMMQGAPEPDRCIRLDDAQINQLRQGLTLDGAVESYDQLLEMRRRVVQRLLHREG